MAITLIIANEFSLFRKGESGWIATTFDGTRTEHNKSDLSKQPNLLVVRGDIEGAEALLEHYGANRWAWVPNEVFFDGILDWDKWVEDHRYNPEEIRYTNGGQDEYFEFFNGNEWVRLGKVAKGVAFGTTVNLTQTVDFTQAVDATFKLDPSKWETKCTQSL